MARIASLGSSLQDIFLIDRDDFASAILNNQSIFGAINIGTKVDIDKIAYEVGGGATNAATSFARHGHESVIFSNIGRDVAGEAVLVALDKEGINRNYLKFADRKNTGCSVILLDVKSGERTILTHRGASATFSNLDPNDLATVRPDWLYITTMRGDLDTMGKFIKQAKRLGTKIMINPGKLELEQPDKLRRLLANVDVLLVNKVEAQMLVPGVLLIELLTKLLNYVNTVIITDGRMGAIASDHQKTYRFGIYEDVKVKDTTGAGDAFGSGFLAHLSAGKSFRQSLIFGSANSTSVVAALGAKRGILTGMEELHQMPIEEVK